MDRIIVTHRRKRLGHVPGYTEIYIGRPSVYGNPYTHHELANTAAMFKVATRGEAIEKYLDFLDKADKTSPLMVGIADLTNRYRDGENFEFICWCAPERCHGDVIKHLIQQAAKPESDE